MTDAETPAQITPDQITDLVHAAVPAVGRLGIRVAHLSPGEVKLVLPFEPNRNHIGTMYAGALVALAELPGGLLPMAMPELDVVPIVVDLHVDFLRAARGDAHLSVRMPPEELRAVAELAHFQGRADFVLDADVRDDEGRTVMTCRATYQLRPARHAPPAAEPDENV